MGVFHLQSGWLRRQISAAVLTVTLPLMTGVLSTALLIVPMTRSAESVENGSPKERCEELSPAARLDHGRHLRLEYCRVVNTHALPTQLSLGHAQRPVLDPPAGHRLPNGLLAPLTC